MLGLDPSSGLGQERNRGPRGPSSPSAYVPAGDQGCPRVAMGRGEEEADGDER